MSLWLKPFALLYHQAADFKNFLYNQNLLPTVQVGPKVISVGNLTLGGTGKTPVIKYLIRNFQRQGRQVAVVSRAYRASAKRPVKVDPSLIDATARFGDEATMLAQNFPEISFFVGQNKAQTCAFAVSQGQFDVILVDDGFQHRALVRNLDIVLLDASEAFSAYEVLPAGRAREPWQALSRAHLIFVTKTNLVEKEKLSEIVKRIPADKPTFFVNYSSGIPTNLFNPKLDWVQSKVLNKKVWLMSALAKPLAFQKLAEMQGFEVQGHSQFRDHHPYTVENVKKVLQYAGEVPVLVTEKDAVKIQHLKLQTDNIWVLPLEIQLNSGDGEINEILAQVFTH